MYEGWTNVRHISSQFPSATPLTFHNRSTTEAVSFTVDPKLTERLNNTAGKMPRLGPDPLAASSGPHAFCASPTAAYPVGIIQAGSEWSRAGREQCLPG